MNSKGAEMVYSLVRRSVQSAIHGSNATNQTETNDNPRVHGHKAVGPSVHVQSSSSNTDNTNSESSVQESVVQEASFVRRHAAVLSRLTVEDEVRRQDSSTNDGGSVEQSLGDVATAVGVSGRLHVCATEGILESLSGLREDRRRGGADGLGLRLEG